MHMFAEQIIIETTQHGDLLEHRIIRKPVEVEKGEALRNELESFLQCACKVLKPKVTGLAVADALDIGSQNHQGIEKTNLDSLVIRKYLNINIICILFWSRPLWIKFLAWGIPFL
jgi:hypothetical protein